MMVRLWLGLVFLATVATCLICPGSISAAGAGDGSSTLLTLDGDGWLLAIDPQNVGRQQQWCQAPRPEAKPTKVPGIIQEPFPGYHGVAWYWRNFRAPQNPNPEGRYLLRFWAVDYMAEVWLNDRPVGGHEGGETPFVLDVTDVIKPGEQNRLAVRVLNPTHKPIDGITLYQTPRQAKETPYRAGSAFNHGGIMDSVELLVAPPVRVEDLYVRPDPKTGIIRIKANIRNAAKKSAQGRIEFTVAPAASGPALAYSTVKRDLPVGDTLVEGQLKVENPRLWDIDDPFSTVLRHGFALSSPTRSTNVPRAVDFVIFASRMGISVSMAVAFTFARPIPVTISPSGSGSPAIRICCGEIFST